MAKRHTVLVLLAVFTLAVVTFFALETSAQNDLTAAQLLQQGIKLLGDGKPAAARQLLRRVDPIQLTRAQRLQLQQALQKANAAPSGPDPTPEPPAPEPETPKAPEPAPEPPPAPAPTPPSVPTADAGAAMELLRDGIKLLDAGKPAQALTQLRLVDPVPLTRPQRLELLEAISQANAQLKPTDVPVPSPPAPPAPQPPTPPTPEPPTPPTPEPPTPPAPPTPPVPAPPTPAPPTPVPPTPVPPTPEPPAPPAPEPPAGNQLLQQAMKLRAQQLVTEAAEAREQGHYNRAAQLYRQAQQIDPGNVQARDGAGDVAALLARDVSGGEGNLVTDYAGVVKLRAEQAKAHFTRAIEEAQKHAAAGRYAEATDAVSLAKAIIDTRRQYLAEADYTQLNKQALDLGAEISKAGEMARLGQIATQERNIRTEETARRLKAETERRRKVQQLLQRAVDLRRELDYEQSVDLLDQVLFLEPNNIAAQAMKEMIEDTIIYRNTRTLMKHRGQQIARHSVENLEATIPYAELIQYPPDWPQLTVRRRALLGEAAGESEANRQTLEKLKQPIPVSFDANRFENVIEYLRNVTSVNFFVNWKALEGAGIEPGTPVTLNLANVPADKALRLILDQVGGDLVPLGYSVDEGVVTISTTESLGKNTAIRTYDIRDLLVQIPDFGEAPDFDLQSITQGGDSAGGGSGGLFSGEGDDAGGLSRGEMVESIMQLIRDTVDADSWRSNGGLVSSMSELNGSLIVNTTSQNHRAVLSLLGQLRETRALSINVEARFLLVDQNFLDEIGIDLDLTGDDWNIAQDSINIADRNNTGINGSFGELGADATGDFSRSLVSNLAGTFLNDVQVTLLVRATQANRRSVQVSAPRLTFFNGQRAYVMIATQLAYVSDLDPIVGTRAAAFDPVISVVSSGVILDVEGTVSADRRYVTLSARPSLARILRLRGILVIGPAVDPGDDDVNPNPDPNVPDVSRGLIEAPELELTTIRTTVSVPDKGTLMMGGQRIVVDIDVEAGVPVLSKVPVLNRLFTNRSTVKDERTLLILIKPTILMQSEKEQQLFPGMDQSPSLFGGDRPPAPAP